MEATYCIGNDVDFPGMFDQYLCKRNENLDLSLSMTSHHNGGQNAQYNAEQTFHTPSFGDEEFDIASMTNGGSQQTANSTHPSHSYHTTQIGVTNDHSGENAMSSNQQMCNTNGYQHGHYMSPPPLPVSSHQDHAISLNQSGNYGNGHQQATYNTLSGSASAMMMHHHQQQQQQQQQQQHYMRQQYGQQQTVVKANSPGNMTNAHVIGQHEPTNTTTTSDDSDDNASHAQLQMTGIKRPSPEPVENEPPKIQKKPKPTKKKKKRDPNEPQKPVSAYALFFRDTQAAIKGQNPNTSFGEVSKIVASMWDSLDAEHKNVYKKKTETAKKDYLKALAAYRASNVCKGVAEGDNVYAGAYGAYNGVYNGYSPPGNHTPTPINTSHQQQMQQQQHANIAKKSPLLMTQDSRLAINGQHQPNMMAHMTQTSHLDHPNQQVGPPMTSPQQTQTQALNTNYQQVRSYQGLNNNSINGNNEVGEYENNGNNTYYQSPNGYYSIY